jgi:hypothetical protein
LKLDAADGWCIALRSERRDLVGHDRDAPVGVRLDPGRLLGPVISFVDREDDPEKRVVLDGPLEELRRVGPDLVTDPGRVAAGGGDDPEQRRDALGHRRLEDVVDLASLVRVQLVDDADVEVLAVERLGLSGQRDESAVVLRAENLVLVRDRADRGREVLSLEEHRLRRVEHDRGLLAGGRGRVDLRPGLAVGREPVEGDARRQGALAVASRDLDVDCAGIDGRQCRGVASRRRW